MTGPQLSCKSQWSPNSLRELPQQQKAVLDDVIRSIILCSSTSLTLKDDGVSLEGSGNPTEVRVDSVAQLRDGALQTRATGRTT